MWIVEHRLGLATRTQISVFMSPFPSVGTAVFLQVPCENGSVETTIREMHVTVSYGDDIGLTIVQNGKHLRSCLD